MTTENKDKLDDLVSDKKISMDLYADVELELPDA